MGPPASLWPSEALTLSLLQFSQQEEKRQKSERLQQQQKHENQMRDMMAQCESNTSELQQLQVQPSLPTCPRQISGCLSFPQGSLLSGTKDSTNGEGVSSEELGRKVLILLCNVGHLLPSPPRL